MRHSGSWRSEEQYMNIIPICGSGNHILDDDRSRLGSGNHIHYGYYVYSILYPNLYTKPNPISQSGIDANRATGLLTVRVLALE